MKKAFTIFCLLSMAAFASATMDVTEWSSDTVAVPGVIMPIGGSGQVNGNFVVAETDGIQIGVRINRRYSPVPLVVENGNEYQIETGESGPGQPLWNYDLHIDFRGSGYSFKDYTIAIIADVANHGSADLQAGLESAYGLSAGDLNNVELFQTSQNPGFFGSGFDPYAVGQYSFSICLTPTGTCNPLTVCAVADVVPEPATLALLGLGALVLRKRK